MIAHPALDAPVEHLDIAGIGRAVEDIEHFLDVHSGPSWKGRGVFQVPLDLGHGLKPPIGEAFENLPNDGSNGLVLYEHLSTPRHGLITVADRSLEDPVAVHQSRAHTIAGLLGVLLTLMLRHARHEVLDKQAVAVVSKLHGRRQQLPAGRFDRNSQLDMCANATGEAIDVVDDDENRALLALLTQEHQHLLHGRPPNEIAGDPLLGENAHNLVPPATGELPAARLLAVQAVAFLDLLGARYATVDHCLLLLSGHCSSSHAQLPRAAACVSTRLVVYRDRTTSSGRCKWITPILTAAPRGRATPLGVGLK
jgi:hypothetical protein